MIRSAEEEYKTMETIPPVSIRIAKAIMFSNNKPIKINIPINFHVLLHLIFLPQMAFLLDGYTPDTTVRQPWLLLKGSGTYVLDECHDCHVADKMEFGQASGR